MQRPQAERPLLEVLQNRPVHPRAKLLRALAVPRVVRETAQAGSLQTVSVVPTTMDALPGFSTKSHQFRTVGE